MPTSNPRSTPGKGGTFPVEFRTPAWSGPPGGVQDEFLQRIARRKSGLEALTLLTAQT